MATQVITGVLHRSKTLRRSANLVHAYAERVAEEAGLREPRYYKERGYVVGETMGTTGRPNVWHLTSLKPFADLADGTRVRYRASVALWDNGNGHSLGGTCSRVRDVEALTAPEEGA